MKEILAYGFTSGITFIAFITFLIFGQIKKRKAIFISSMIFLTISITAGGIAAYKTVTKVRDFFEPRTGEEIYAALFDKPEKNCVKILNYQDQFIPKIDYAIWLHTHTCPHELNRILNKVSFKFKSVSTQGMNSNGPLANDNWFKPESLGDTILIFNNINEYGNGKEIYSNTDSTEIYVKEILD